MISGIDRYYQIARCFRDEDLRSDRQPEFTQVDCELCFADGKMLSYSDAINKFGSDKPDLRNPIKLINITNILNKKNIIYKNSFISAIKCSSQISLNQDQIEEYRKYVISHGENSSTLEVAGKLRLKLGLDFNLTDLNSWHPIWITNYPLFKLEKNHQFSSMHHPFTAPDNMNLELLDFPLKVKSTAYDLVINGCELGSGSSRIHKHQIQKKIFKILGMNNNKQKQEFGFFLDALRYGAPPHAGFAFGLDRVIMLISNMHKIRNVIAFPKTTSAADLMTNSPKEIN
uniref:Aminoacyl-transfer RNA synthetases class-II family profile domain-containing protein n=1 Tax=Glossina pallidipes TaxID=7398 RepID=A0A1A9Z132_GLOPL